MTRGVLVLTASSVAVICLMLPVFATHTAEHAADEIWAVADQAEQEMADVVSEFEDRIAGFESEGEVDLAADDAEAEIEAIWSTAKSAIQDLVKLYPGELGEIGGSAKQQLQEARQTSRVNITDLAAAWAPPTTTTTLPSTTTTTTAATTTTTHPSKNSGNQPASPPPDSDNGGGPPEPPGQPESPGSPAETEPRSTPNDQPASPDAQSQGSVSVPESPMDQAGGTFLVLAAETPDQQLALGSDSFSEILESSQSGATAKMAAVLETVLPPAVVDLVLSPMLVLEILVRTTLDGGSKSVGPLFLLGAFALGIFVYDRSTKRGRLLHRA